MQLVLLTIFSLELVENYCLVSLFDFLYGSTGLKYVEKGSSSAGRVQLSSFVSTDQHHHHRSQESSSKTREWNNSLLDES